MRRREFITGTAATAAMGFARPTFAQTETRLPAIKRIAMVHPSEPPEGLSINGRPAYKAFFGELNKLGYNEGQNLILERYSAFGHSNGYEDVARAIVAGHPDLIVSLGGPVTRVLKPLTATIPILAITSDPVAGGMVTNLAKPDRNITGATTDVGLEIWGKRLELLRETVGKLINVRFLMPPSLIAFWEMAGGPARALEAARRDGIAFGTALVAEPFDWQDFERKFNAMAAEKVDGLMVGAVAEFFTYRQLIVDAAARHHLPAIYFAREWVDIGGLLSYGYDTVAIMRRIADMTDQILKGAKPGDIPFYQPTKLELVLNRTTARSLELEFPPSLLAAADEIIG
ncbi:ABC transporter substrate-binding protein [Bradyrhizobium jicamae]|uniref:ABC transporter substrate-binding protein n=1 Tax=Bradyrhizobium jicamae TaxID=280332 RepID=A0ABS5FSN8_9BRAD|nr:ABC transporter substrate-binding protein [Bradyrhizobium jicamae]MBR0799276.1 ABC transporter substrate-binding protein [Bradyrhizobium jicamae]